MKSFGVRFYQGYFHDQAEANTVHGLLCTILNKQNDGESPPQIGDGPMKHELRELASSANGDVIQGVLALVRDDAPHIREADGGERPIELEDQEGILEKNYFLYYRKQQLLVWQVNGRASHISRFENYLASYAGTPVKFYDILQEGSFERLRNGLIKSLKFRIAKRRNANAIDPHNWESDVFDLMGGIGGTVIEVKVSTRRKGRGLIDKTSDVIHRMMNRDDVSSLQVRMDGQREPIDLFADRISDRIEVQMVGHYPLPRDIIIKLAEAKDRQKQALEASLGTGDEILE